MKKLECSLKKLVATSEHHGKSLDWSSRHWERGEAEKALWNCENFQIDLTIGSNTDFCEELPPLASFGLFIFETSNLKWLAVVNCLGRLSCYKGKLKTPRSCFPRSHTSHRWNMISSLKRKGEEKRWRLDTWNACRARLWCCAVHLNSNSTTTTKAKQKNNVYLTDMCRSVLVTSPMRWDFESHSG